MADFYSFLNEYKIVIIFYTVVILLVYLNRKKFDIQAKIIALYRTKIGIDTIHKTGKKYSELIKIIGYIGIGIGFIGMIAISATLIQSLWTLFTVPTAPPAITPIIPGVKIPGSPIFVPLFYGIIALFIVVVVHEFSHGIVAAAHGIKIKHTGIFFLGPLIGAFVEPDEKEIKKQKDTVQYSIFAAGPFSNMILGLVAILMIGYVFSPVQGLISNNLGVGFTDVQNNTPAKQYGLHSNMTIISVDGTKIENTNDFEDFLSSVKPNQTIMITTDKKEDFNVTLTTHPDNPKKGYIGVIDVHTVTKLKYDNVFFKITDTTLAVIMKLLFWVYLLSFGIGLANLLPIGPVDGGRMLQVALLNTTKNEKKGNMIWTKVTIFTLIIILVLLVVPIIRHVLFR